ncbi:MAG: ATP-binding protein [Pseudomonadota bacterium]
MYPRWQKKLVLEAMKTRRVVLLSGIRQCGKTTLARDLMDNEMEYRTLDDVGLRKAAENDPQAFVKRIDRPLIIDEVQRVPDLLLAIKMAVDEDTRPGQYLLTGSTNIQSIPSVRESLAGRITKLRLRPLSQGELHEISHTFLKRAFRQELKTPEQHYDRDALIDAASVGGFPEARLLEDHAQRGWHKDYIESILDRDLQDITKIRDQDAMRELVNVTAAWSSKFINLNAIGSHLSIRSATLRSYLNALEALYIIDRVRPWTKTDYDRVGKADKLFFADSGLMFSLLDWHKDQVRFDSYRLGKLIETFAYNELSAHVDADRDQYTLKHYRDRQQREIDFMIERNDGALLMIEVKAGSNIANKDFKHMRWFKENIAPDRSCVGLVLHTGKHAASFGDDMWMVPFGALWT